MLFLQHPVVILAKEFTNPDHLTNDLCIANYSKVDCYTLPQHRALKQRDVK